MSSSHKAKSSSVNVSFSFSPPFCSRVHSPVASERLPVLCLLNRELGVSTQHSALAVFSVECNPRFGFMAPWLSTAGATILSGMVSTAGSFAGRGVAGWVDVSFSGRHRCTWLPHLCKWQYNINIVLTCIYYINALLFWCGVIDSIVTHNCSCMTPINTHIHMELQINGQCLVSWAVLVHTYAT